MLLAILAIILLLLVVIGVHEIGHAVVGKWFGVAIKQIAIGFGKPLLTWRSQQGYEWVWARWPLGGYVHFLNTRNSTVEPKDYPFALDKKPIWQRLLVLSSGVAANLITAWLVFSVVFYIGISYKVPKIEHIAPQSLAEQAGLKSNDQFIAVAGSPTPSWQEVGKKLIMAWGQEHVPVVIQSATAHEKKTLYLNLSQVTMAHKGRSLLSILGISPKLSAPQQEIRCHSLLEAMQTAWFTLTDMLCFFIIVLKDLCCGVIPFSLLLGPLGLLSMSVATLSQGGVLYLYFLATLSVAVALVNILPIPGLDGGLMVYAMVEKVRGRPISIALEVLIHRLVYIAFTMLLVQLVLNDLTRYYL